MAGLSCQRLYSKSLPSEFYQNVLSNPVNSAVRPLNNRSLIKPNLVHKAFLRQGEGSHPNRGGEKPCERGWIKPAFGEYSWNIFPIAYHVAETLLSFDLKELFHGVISDAISGHQATRLCRKCTYINSKSSQ